MTQRIMHNHEGKGIQPKGSGCPACEAYHEWIGSTSLGGQVEPDKAVHPQVQTGPTPDDEPDYPYEPPGLRELVRSITYKPGWEFRLSPFREDGEARCWAFYVISDTENSLDPTKRIRVKHEFLVPPASYRRDVWAAWLLDRIGDVEMHERNEFFRLDGVREFAPHHSRGEDPYRTWHVSDYATAAKRNTDD